MSARARRLFMLALCAMVLSTGLLMQQGCYQRVTGARGLGASNIQLQESYQENSKVDDWIFGERTTKDRYRRIGD